MKLSNQQVRGIIKAMGWKPVPYESTRTEIFAQLSNIISLYDGMEIGRKDQWKLFVSGLKSIVFTDGHLTMLEMGRFLDCWQDAYAIFGENNDWFSSPIYDLLYTVRNDDLKQFLSCIGMDTAKHRDMAHILKDWDTAYGYMADKARRLYADGDHDTANVLADLVAQMYVIKEYGNELCRPDLIIMWETFKDAYIAYGRDNGWHGL